MTINDRILRRPEVEHLTGIKKSFIYVLMQKGEFPKPVKIGERAVGWRTTDIQKWLDDRAAA